MDFSNAAHVTAIVATVAGGANFIMMLVIKAAVSDVKTQIAEARLKDANELREWVERHFERKELRAR